MNIEDATVLVLRRTQNTAVMWGDSVLLHQIAHEMGWESNGRKTEKKVLDALSRAHSDDSPVTENETLSDGHWVRYFRLKEVQP